MLWIGTALAAPPPIELVGLEATPRLPVACELHVADHDGEVPFLFRLELSAPDDAGRAWVQRVRLDPRTPGIPAASPVAVLHEVDPHVPYFDERLPDAEGRQHVARVRPRSVDLGTWPLSFSFIAPRADDPATLGEYQLKTDPEASKQDWGSCILRVTGPGGVSACAIVADAPGSSCLAAYAERHGLGPR